MTLHVYTRYVKILRLVLPAIAILGFLSLLIWPWWKEHRQSRLDRAANPAPVTATATGQAAPLQVEKPDYQGLDNKGRAYRVTALRVEQNLDPKAPILLVEPNATLTLEEATATAPARTLSLQALNGLYDAQAQTLDLKGAVILHFAGDYAIQAEDLAVDMVGGYASTTTPIHGQGPRGFLSAQSLNIADKGAVVVLKGPTKLVLQPEPAPTDNPPRSPSMPPS